MNPTGRTLRAVGFWPNGRPETHRFPHPTRLVDEGWREDERPRLAAYLRGGHRLVQYRGFSHCRFRPCARPEWMGSWDLTDGEWVWPEGLTHYVEVHGIVLPDEFVRSAEARGWKLADCPRGELREYDFEFWQAWGAARGAAG